MDANDLRRFIEATRGSQSAIRQAIRWEFGILSLEADTAEVPVRFFLQSGESLPATYHLVREKRLWKIDGVVFGEPAQTRATAGLRL